MYGRRVSAALVGTFVPSPLKIETQTEFEKKNNLELTTLLIKTLDTELLTRLLLLARVGEYLLDHNDIRFIV